MSVCVNGAGGGGTAVGGEPLAGRVTGLAASFSHETQGLAQRGL